MKQLRGISFILMSCLLLFADGYLEDEIVEGDTPVIGSTEADIFSYQEYCGTCQMFVALLMNYIRSGIEEYEIIRIGMQICKLMEFSTPTVCESAAELYGSISIHIMEKIEKSPDEVCGIILGGCTGMNDNPLGEWNISFPAFQKPRVAPIQLQSEYSPRLKVLHLSDTHYDPFYADGSNSDCLEPLCCRHSDDFLASSVSFRPAGKWGSYKCDLPKRTLENLLDHINQTHKDIDYVIWTGDLITHDVWNQTNEQNMAIIEEHIKLVLEKLPGVPIYPCIGKHERAPVNFFPSPDQDSSVFVLYEQLSKLWEHWLPIHASKTVRNGAFYSILVRPGLRLISLNMNVCNNLNLWLLLNPIDQLDQLEWLVDELQSAEHANEKVHIIGHIPPGYMDYIKLWSHNYYEIVARYESTIAAQFFGHTHFDEFEVFYDPKNLSRATNIAYIGPSVTPHKNLNPAYRIYYIDGDHADTARSVVDHETWFMDLDEANRNDAPIWRKSYTAKDAYSLPGLRPHDWSDLISRMEHDDELFDLYYRNYWRNSSLRTKCSIEIKKNLLCQAKQGRSHDRHNLCIDLYRIQDDVNISPESHNSKSNGHGHALNPLDKAYFVILSLVFLYQTLIFVKKIETS